MNQKYFARAAILTNRSSDILNLIDTEYRVSFNSIHYIEMYTNYATACNIKNGQITEMVYSHPRWKDTLQKEIHAENKMLASRF